MVLDLPYPFPAAPMGKVTHLSLIHLRFTCRVVGYSNLSHMWDALVQGKGKMEGLTTLNHALMRSLISCRQVVGGRAYFRAYLPLLSLVRNVSLMNPYLDPACAGGWGFHAVDDSAGNCRCVHPWG